MTTSEQINEITTALVKAQSVMRNAGLNKVNPHFKSKYADLAGIRDAVIPSLTAHGIAVVQTLDAPGLGRTYLLTRLLHTSGQWIESLCPIPETPDMQKMGSAITYARRYSLSAICGIAADEDDDGNAASQPTNRLGDFGRHVAQTPQAPDGYDDWLVDLEAVAQNGIEALKATWAKSQPYFRKHLTDTNPTTWTALKLKAEKVKVPAHA